MNFDDRLKAAWQGGVPHASQAQLTARVRRHRQRHRLQRAGEVALTCVAVVVFGYALLSGSAGPAHWLLLPFFLVYLPVVWAIVLRKPGQRGEDASEPPQVYARIRLSQLRASLRDLWLMRRVMLLLLAYAVLANAAVFLLGDADWRGTAMTLLAYALACVGVTWLASHRLRRRRLREYRSTRRMSRR